jgi:hypothetical protein
MWVYKLEKESIMLWVYKVVDMEYSNGRADIIKTLLLWHSVTTDRCRQQDRCSCDRTRLVETERSNGHGDRIGPLLLWPSSTHRKIFLLENGKHIERYMI